MKRKFIEISGVTAFLKKLPDTDKLLITIQNELLKNPDKGDIVPGCGGLRKLRLASETRGKGKRGGYRLLYLDLPQKEKTYLIHIYGKDEKDDISEEGKKQVRNLVSVLKKEA